MIPQCKLVPVPILARSDGLDGSNEVIELGTSDLFRNLSLLQDLECRNHPYPELLRQWLIPVAQHRNKAEGGLVLRL